MNCLFCQIINKKIPADIIYEDEKFVVFRSIKPEAPVHLLFTSKKHIEWKDEFNEKDLVLLAGLISAAKKIAIKEKIDKACKFIFNVGKTGHILHIHLHLLGGWEKEIPTHNI